MDANAQYELYLIKNELQGIIDELYSIAGGISSDFEGIGNEKCANSVIAAAKQYESVKQKLNNMDLSAVTEEFAARKRAEAEAKAILRKAEAQAEANEKIEKSLSKNVLENNKIEKWDGKLPYATGGSAILDVSADGEGENSEN